MTFDFTNLSVVAGDGTEKAASMLLEELLLRGQASVAVSSPVAPCVIFERINASVLTHDGYSLKMCDGMLTISAEGTRGLIYGFSMFLRKLVFDEDKVTLIKDISGEYVPYKKVRGHQLGYRPSSNAYDAWTPENYRRYYRDLMFFGCNMVEHIHEENQNDFMKLSSDELVNISSEIADEYDLGVSVWYPNRDDEITDTAVASRKKYFESIPRLDTVFPPGGDPGEMPANEFIERCCEISKVLKEVKPDAQMWPSAQQPHSMPEWGDEFIESISKEPDAIDGVITGPNWAFPLDVLRRKLPTKYPIRLYPDITHNVRCEYPVHFDSDDWHYALAAALSRECINPRPTEYRKIHRLTAQYVIGSVSYSDGVNDDINKFIWSDMDYFRDVDLRDSLCDYSRLFFAGLPADTVADGILMLEANWNGDPAENYGIEAAFLLWQGLADKHPNMLNNWRFVQCLFRAECDALVRSRRLFELGLVSEARYLLKQCKIKDAYDCLCRDFDGEYIAMRKDIDRLASMLYNLIGMQLSVEKFGASGWERGATLDTLDLPVTDRAWLKKRIEYAMTLSVDEREAFITLLLNRNNVQADERYFSVAEHGLDILGVAQNPYFYMNFQGDRPEVNNGSIPMSMLKVYDHFSFKCKLGGFLSDTDYRLRLTVKGSSNPISNQFRITINGCELYKGKPYGGKKDEKFDRLMLCDGFHTESYTVPASFFQNGCADIEISEPSVGIELCEFWITKEVKTECP